MAGSGMLYMRVTASVLETLGMLLTAWRIYFRLKIDRFWWEDTFAAVMLVTALPWLVAFWVYITTNGLASIVTSWFYNIGFGCIVTLARTSVLFSIIRIIQGNSRLLRFTYVCVTLFFAFWITLITEKIIQCAPDPSWHHIAIPDAKPFCAIKPHIWIFEFTTDVVAVSILVVLPLRMLWRVKLPRRQRRMILSIFASSVVLGFATLFHTVGQIMNVYNIMDAGMHVEVASSLIVCNLLVVVTYTYQFLLHDGPRQIASTEDMPECQDDDFTTRPMRLTPTTTFPLTTVDLEASFTDRQFSASSESVWIAVAD